VSQTPRDTTYEERAACTLTGTGAASRTHPQGKPFRAPAWCLSPRESKEQNQPTMSSETAESHPLVPPEYDKRNGSNWNVVTSLRTWPALPRIEVSAGSQFGTVDRSRSRRESGDAAGGLRWYPTFSWLHGRNARGPNGGHPSAGGFGPCLSVPWGQHEARSPPGEHTGRRWQRGKRRSVELRGQGSEKSTGHLAAWSEVYS